MIIGVSDISLKTDDADFHKKDTICGYSASGWIFNNQTPKIGSDESFIDKGFSSGSVVWMQVEKNEGKLKFIIEGWDLGWVFQRDFIKHNRIVFFVSCYENGDDVEIVQ